MYKPVNIKVHKEDINPVLTSCIQLILNRHQKNLKILTSELDANIKSSRSLEIIKNLESLEESFNKSIFELANLLPLIKEIDSQNSSTDTEVLEDLSDLEKDGLGVDDGSE